MSDIMIKVKELPDITRDLESPEELDLIFKVLDPNDTEMVMDTADCLADTFAGVDIGGRKICEPMAMAVGLSKEAMYDFTLEYLNAVAIDGLCCIAIDKETNRVIGAVASDNFDPNEEVPCFEGHLEGMNYIYEFLIDIDEVLINTIEQKTGRGVEKDQFVHMLLAGSRLSKFKSYVVAKLVKMIMEIGREKGYRGIFAEATSDNSAKVLTKYHGFTHVKDTKGKPIMREYVSHDSFKEIPNTVAPGCRIIYQAFDKAYDLD